MFSAFSESCLWKKVSILKICRLLKQQQQPGNYIVCCMIHGCNVVWLMSMMWKCLIEMLYIHHLFQCAIKSILEKVTSNQSIILKWKKKRKKEKKKKKSENVKSDDTVDNLMTWPICLLSNQALYFGNGWYKSTTREIMRILETQKIQRWKDLQYNPTPNPSPFILHLHSIKQYSKNLHCV